MENLDVNDLQKRINDLENKLKKSEQLRYMYMMETQCLRDYLKIQRNQIDDCNKKIENRNKEIERHVNSIRYRMGTAFIDSTKSFKNFMRLPYILMKLYKEK